MTDATAPQGPPGDFTSALRVMREEMMRHPHWRRVEGTPLANDLPVVAARMAVSWLAAARLSAGEAEVRVGGAYELPDGRSFWVDGPVSREIARRVVDGANSDIGEKTFNEMPGGLPEADER